MWGLQLCAGLRVSVCLWHWLAVLARLGSACVCLWLVGQQQPELKRTGRRTRFSPFSRSSSLPQFPLHHSRMWCLIFLRPGLTCNWALGLRASNAMCCPGSPPPVTPSKPCAVSWHSVLKVSRLTDHPKSHIPSFLTGIGSSAFDCCLSYSQKDLPTRVVTSYRLQGPKSGCFLRAVV